MNVSNVMNNVRALLSSGQRRPDNAEVVDDGETGRGISEHFTFRGGICLSQSTVMLVT